MGDDYAINFSGRDAISLEGPEWCGTTVHQHLLIRAGYVKTGLKSATGTEGISRPQKMNLQIRHSIKLNVVRSELGFQYNYIWLRSEMEFDAQIALWEDQTAFTSSRCLFWSECKPPLGQPTLDSWIDHRNRSKGPDQWYRLPTGLPPGSYFIHEWQRFRGHDSAQDQNTGKFQAREGQLQLSSHVTELP